MRWSEQNSAKQTQHGRTMTSKTRFLKTSSPNFRLSLTFCAIFYTDHIKFHILIVINEFCYNLQKTLMWRMA